MKNIKITIGIIAYNEELNVANLFASIAMQKGNFNIDEILVYSDGSTDKTKEEVQKEILINKKIKFIDSKKRVGKSRHLNALFKLAKNPIIVLFDADVVLASIKTINNLIQPLLLDKQVALVGGNPKPRKGKTFIENAINYTFYAYYPLKSLLRGGNNIFGCDGRILALRKKFGISVKIPTFTFANDAFLYFSCLSKGYKYRHISQASVWFRSPSNIKDQIKQNQRFIAAHQQMHGFFGNITDREYSVPQSIMLKLKIKQFMKSPFHGAIIFIINLYCRYKAKKFVGKKNALWPMASSTKGGIQNEH